MSLNLWKQGTPMLDARPATAEELRWWSAARRPYRRRALLLGFPAAAPLLVMEAARDPAGLLGWKLLLFLPIVAASWLGAGWLGWRLAERSHMESALAGKRIRDRLGADAPGAGET